MDNHPGHHQMDATITIRNIKKIRLVPTHEPQGCSDEEADEEEISIENDDRSIKERFLTSLITGTHLSSADVNELRDTLLDEVESKLSKNEQAQDLDRLELSATLACYRWDVSRFERCLNYKEFISELEQEIRQRLRRRHLSAGNQVCLCLVDDDDDARIENRGCGHRLHPECWAGMISAQVTDITNEALTPWESQRHAFTCSVPDCGCVLSEEILNNRIAIEEKKEMAKQDLFIRSFKGVRSIQNTAGQLVNTEPYYLQRCPQDGCQEVHVVSEKYPTEIECKGIWYCLLCRGPSHAPASCRGMDQWQQRLTEYLDRQRDMERILQEERHEREARNFPLLREAHHLHIPPPPSLTAVRQEEMRQLGEARRRAYQEQREARRQRDFEEWDWNRRLPPSLPSMTRPNQGEPTLVGCFGPGPDFFPSPVRSGSVPVAPFSGRSSDNLPYSPSPPPYGRQPVTQPIEQLQGVSASTNNNNQQATSSSSSLSSTVGIRDVGPLELWLSELREPSSSLWFEFAPSTTVAPSSTAVGEFRTSATVAPSSAAVGEFGTSTTTAQSGASGQVVASGQVGTSATAAQSSAASNQAGTSSSSTAPGPVGTVGPSSAPVGQNGHEDPASFIDLTAVEESYNEYDLMGSDTASSVSSISVISLPMMTETPSPTMQSDETGRGQSTVLMPLPIDRAWLRANSLETVARRPLPVQAVGGDDSLFPMTEVHAAHARRSNETRRGARRNQPDPFDAIHRSSHSHISVPAPPTFPQVTAAPSLATTATAVAAGGRSVQRQRPPVPPRPSTLIRAARAFDATLPPVSRTSGIVKPCPGPHCDALIEKINGCNHVKCNRCKVDFCFACLRLMTTGPKVCCQNVRDDRPEVLNRQRRRMELRMLQTRLGPYRDQYEQHQAERNQDVELSEASLIKGHSVAATAARVLIRAGSFLTWLTVLCWELNSTEPLSSVLNANAIGAERDLLRPHPPHGPAQRRRTLANGLRNSYETLQARVRELRAALNGCIEKGGVDPEWILERSYSPVLHELKETMDRIDQGTKDVGLKVLRFRMPSVD